MDNLLKEQFQIIGVDTTYDDVYYEKSLSYWQNVKRKFLHNKVAMLTCFVLLCIIIMTLISPMLTNFDYMASNNHTKDLFPSSTYWFGTDREGRDLFSRIWAGGRTSLLIGFTTAFINLSIGIVYGSICGHFGGMVDDVVMRILEILSSIPNLVIVILISLILGPGIYSLIISMSIIGWCPIARLIRGQLLQLKQQEYVLAAQSLGSSASRIIGKHLITNLINIAIITITLEIPNVILNETLLSFIGVGVSDPNISWGIIARDTYNAFIFRPYQTFIPAFIISLTLICFNLLGDGLSDALDPKGYE